MKRVLSLALTLVLSLSFAQETLNLLIWSEYIDPDVITQFEEEFNARVVIDTYESNQDAIAKLEAGGLGLYDVVVPSQYVLPIFIELGLLQPLDHSVLTNLENLSNAFTDPPYDPGNVYTVAYQWGTTGIAYRNDLVETPTSWGVLFDPEMNGGQPFALLDDPRAGLGIALLYLGYDYNSEEQSELIEARDLLIETKNRSLGFYGSPAARNLLLAGNAVYAIVYSGDALGAFADDARISYSMPDEGSEIWVDSLAILANAPNPTLANEFINFILRPEISAAISNYVYYATPNEAAFEFLDEDLLNDPLVFLTSEDFERLTFAEDIENVELYDLIWTQVKSR